jgi:hypothetical protein
MIKAANDIYITVNGEAVSISPIFDIFGKLDSIKYYTYISDGQDLFPIVKGLRSVFSDGVDYLYLKSGISRVSGSDFVCQQIFDGIFGSDFVCQWSNEKDLITAYLSAKCVKAVCQKTDRIITYISVTYTSPVCQQLNESMNYVSAAFVNPACQKRAEVIRYMSAEYVGVLCQQTEQTTSYTSAVYESPVCQQAEQMITYIAASFTSPVCQIFDNTPFYALANYTNPVCQHEDVFFFVDIKLEINLKKHPMISNAILITWQFGEDAGNFETAIRLHSVIETQSGALIGIGEIDIKFDVSGTSGNVMQKVNNISSFATDGTTLTDISPDNVNGNPITVIITLN